uniref:Uncharacterized protein n=1 Tax=uncultured Alphaproteobacteria bacterium TaxID=91750 RepID=A0A6G8F1Z8_9PROT|nr:hypothetical protein PlAlph_0210 [uncultured Alphaproteobacteria bacterium]
MLGNPLAADIHRVFKNNIVNTANIMNTYMPGATAEDKILRTKRVERFIDAINKFFVKSGISPQTLHPMWVDEKKLINFSLQLSGYIRDAQKSLDKLSNEYARDHDLTELYRAAAHYTVACNGKVAGNKYRFEHNKDYCFWHIDNPQNLARTTFSPVEKELSPGRHTLILSMPFHINPIESDLRKWTYEYMHNTFANETFGKDIDVYLAHFPIEQPRGEKFSLTLDTLNSRGDFFEATDLRFVNRYLKPFIAKNLILDKNANVVNGQPCSAKELADNFRDLNFFGYCAGTAHAHRWISTVRHISGQLYPEAELKNAMKEIFVASYAFLPFKEENAYSGVHFMSNFGNDAERKEPFIKMFNPEVYEQVKYQNDPCNIRITLMPDQRNYIVASKLPQDLIIVDNDQKLKRIPNQENGHHIAFLTTPNLASEDNFISNMFANVLENAALGKRGQAVFAPSKLQNPNHILQNAAALGMQHRFSRNGLEL